MMKLSSSGIPFVSTYFGSIHPTLGSGGHTLGQPPSHFSIVYF